LRSPCCRRSGNKMPIQNKILWIVYWIPALSLYFPGVSQETRNWTQIWKKVRNYYFLGRIHPAFHFMALCLNPLHVAYTAICWQLRIRFNSSCLSQDHVSCTMYDVHKDLTRSPWHGQTARHFAVECMILSAKMCTDFNNNNIWKCGWYLIMMSTRSS
jgi:hypothetical protein